MVHGWRYGRLALVVVGCLVLSAATQVPPPERASDGPQGGEVGANPYRDAQGDQGTLAPAPPLRFQDSRQTGGYRADCAEPKDREDSDLCAQWGAVEGVREGNRMAAEAKALVERANTLALRGLWLTGFEFGALLATLLVTAWAAVAASRAARAADQAVEITRQLGQIELRAYLSLSGSAIRGLREGLDPTADLTFRNDGTTPATIFLAETYIGMYPYPKHGELRRPDLADLPSRHVLTHGGDFTNHPKLNKALTAQDVFDLQSGRKIIYVYGTITYFDIFQEKRVLEFRLMTGGPVPLREGALAWCSEGNRST